VQTEQQPDPLTRVLARRLARPVAPADRARAALQLLDWLGCAAIGRRSAAGGVLARWVAPAPAGPCTALGVGPRGAADAALINGALGNVFELDDVHREALLHPGDVVVPAALAVAQREGAGATALLDALVLGYEAAIAIGRLAGPPHYRHWYSSATCGVYGAAAACAALLGLDEGRTVDALALAGMQSSGPWQCREEPGFAKQLAAGRAAQSGVQAADLAQAGLVGPTRILEGAHGWLRATGAALDGIEAAAQAWAAADPHWQIHAVSHKPWPACRHVHPAIGAALELRRTLPSPADITGVEVKTYAAAIAFADRPEPRTPHEARFSLQHTVAVALARGDLWLADTQADAIDDPVLTRLRGRVSVSLDARHEAAYPARFGAGLVVRLAGQATPWQVDVDTAAGDPECPLRPAAVHAKALRLLGSAGVAPAPAERLAAATLALADGGSLRAWTDCFAAVSEALEARDGTGAWWL
jgi:2-methylcitrate dehydratase PrpD